jgi:type I restriction enzyme S subunit
LNLPGREEQLAIAATLDRADQCVEGHKKQLELLEKEKRALMQQLLTGKRRVKLLSENTTPAKELAS